VSTRQLVVQYWKAWNIHIMWQALETNKALVETKSRKRIWLYCSVDVWWQNCTWVTCIIKCSNGGSPTLCGALFAMFRSLAVLLSSGEMFVQWWTPNCNWIEQKGSTKWKKMITWGHKDWPSVTKAKTWASFGFLC
jgi:hypothetical protein